MKLFKRESGLAPEDKAPAPTSKRSATGLLSGATVEALKHAASGTTAQSSTVASDMQLVGHLEGAGDVVIEGRIEGNISAQQVRIEERGQVKGDIKAQHIIINGRAEGELHADTVTLQSEGLVEGAIFTDELIINKGGVFLGQSQKKTALPADKARGKAKAGLLAVTGVGEMAASAKPD